MKEGNELGDRLIFCLLISGLAGLLGGCQKTPQPAAGASGSSVSSSEEGRSREQRAQGKVTDYRLKGVVKKVEVDEKRVTIAHEAIPGFMAAMTMSFQLGSRGVLETLKPEDSVEATLHVIEKDGVVSEYELRDLKVVGRPARDLILSVTKGKVSVRERPKLLEIGDPVPDFVMATQDGKQLKLSDLRGDVVGLTFIYTRCPLPDFCPLMDRKFGELAGKIAANPVRARRIRLISLSFDPEHDTPDVLAKHARIRGAAPPLWVFAVAAHEELAKIAPALGLFYEPGQNEIAHNLCTAIIDPEGKLARVEVGTSRNKWESVDLLKTIYALLPRDNKAGSQR
jgi:protein SCO1